MAKRNGNPEQEPLFPDFDGAMKALKLKTAAASKPTRQGHEFRSDWLGKFAKGAKLGTDGTLA